MKYTGTLFLGIFVSLLFNGCGGSGSNGDKQNVDTNPSVREIITNQVEKYDLPAMGIIVVDKNSTIYNESIGVKTYTSQEPVTHQELWGIGSITKSMSATLVAILVDQGVIGWNTTLLEVFPEFEEDMQEKYKSVTLIELLSHTSGLPADDDSTWEDFIDLQESVVDQRYAFSYEALAYTSDGVVGEYNYSNINYVITASILEKLTNTNYEMLMQAYLFDPLQMDSAQIDIENLQNNVWGHKIVQDGWEPVDPQTISADNVAIVSPAGSRTYASLDDMAKYLQFHLRTKMGENTTVFNTTNAQMLYTPVVSLSANMGYALGWFTEAPNTIQHSGSNGRWLALTVVDARSGYAYFVVTNGYKEGIEQAVFETMDLLIAKTKNS